MCKITHAACVVGSEASGGSLSFSENEADVDDAVDAGGATSRLLIYFTPRLKQLFTL